MQTGNLLLNIIAVSLSKMVCEGQRPRFDRIPKDVPLTIKGLIPVCWHQDPMARPSLSGMF